MSEQNKNNIMIILATVTLFMTLLDARIGIMAATLSLLGLAILAQRARPI